MTNHITLNPIIHDSKVLNNVISCNKPSYVTSNVSRCANVSAPVFNTTTSFPSINASLDMFRWICVYSIHKCLLFVRNVNIKKILFLQYCDITSKHETQNVSTLRYGSYCFPYELVVGAPLRKYRMTGPRGHRE